METGSDIFFFWVARMVMQCSYLTLRQQQQQQQQLEQTVPTIRSKSIEPIKRVLLHALIRDAKGRKMSKSVGNVIDPMDVIEGRTLEEMLQRLPTTNISMQELKR
jgi:valyl-tRNA synthetase